MRQSQFLTVVSADEARRRWDAAIGDLPRRVETVPLERALGRVLASDVVAPYDVPAFDRSNLDGFAVCAEDTFGAEDEAPKSLQLTGESLVPGQVPRLEVTPGHATPIATGAVVPRGADAVVPLEHTDLVERSQGDDGHVVLVRRPAVPGGAISGAGSDVARGETVLFAGTTLTSRETGTLAACGIGSVGVLAKPRVAILSTGGEVIPPGSAPAPARVFDANATILADAVRELGGEPVAIGIVEDALPAVSSALERAVASADLVLVSGGTSKGGGDLVPDAVAALGTPGLVVHGVDLKPGKPLGLAVARGVPIALLPGFPTSAVFTFHEVVAPLLRRMAGDRDPARGTLVARMPRHLIAERGRTEYLLVMLVEAHGEGRPGDHEGRPYGQPMEASASPGSPGAPTTTVPAPARPVAYPMGKGSGSVTAFARADGFVRIGGDVEFLERDQEVTVTLLGRDVRPADLVVIGSHCVGLDAILSHLAHAERPGGPVRAKAVFVGSTAGLDASKRGECDLAPIHLFDPATGRYNAPFLSAGVSLLRGYGRRQGLCFRRGDPRFEGRSLDNAVAAALADPACRLANRNRGSGTRVLVDGLLQGARPPGYAFESKTHHGVAAAVAQGRADFGVCLEGVARSAGLSFLFAAEERYDFVVPDSRSERPAVRAFAAALADAGVRARLVALGMTP